MLAMEKFEFEEKDSTVGKKNKNITFLMAFKRCRTKPCDPNTEFRTHSKSPVGKKQSPVGKQNPVISKKIQMLLVTRNFGNGITPHLFNNSSALFLLWLIAYFSFFAILILQTSMTLVDYMSHPVTVEITLETGAAELEFPAVALCNNNVVKKSFISRITFMRSLALLDEFAWVNFDRMEASVYKPKLNKECESLGMFSCIDGSNRCIPNEWKCNNRTECYEGFDEDKVICLGEKPKYSAGQICIKGYDLCPGEITCAKYCDGNKECVLYPGFDESEEGGCNNTCIKTLKATSEEQVLQSLNYPENYPDFLDCEYEINAPVGKRIQIEFEDFYLENDTSCVLDYVMIQDGHASPATYLKFGLRTKICGNLPKIEAVNSTNNVVVIIFHTDSVINERGWSLKYKIYPSDTSIESRNKRSSDYDYYYYDYDYTYDYDYYSDYDYKLPTVSPEDYAFNYNYYEFSTFQEIDRYNWFAAYEKSNMPDFSDFKNFVKFEQIEIIGNGHQKSDFIVQCVFNGEFCEPSHFETVQTPLYGNCFLFNTVVKPQASKNGSVGTPRHTSKMGSQYGLKLSLFLDKDEYIGILGQNSGARISLFNSKEAPPIDIKGLYISAGTATILSLKQEAVKRETDPFTECAEAWPQFLQLSEGYLSYDYTQEYCRHLCIMRELALRCKCTDTFDWDFPASNDLRNLTRIQCDVWNATQVACVTETRDDFTSNRRTCDCPVPCTERNLRIERSTTEWPTEPYAPYFASLMLRSTSKRVQGFINDAVKDKKIQEKADLVNLIKKNFARVEINFEELKYTAVKETPKYNISTLFGTLGGNLGLWLGWSILSVFEILEWIYKLIVILTIRRR